MPKVETKFVIFTAARSGSTALTVTLNTHPDVYCHGSPFYESDRGLQALRPEAAAAIDTSKRQTDPVQYVADILNFSPGPKIVGLKMWRRQSRSASDALAADQRIKKIILHRRNYLACFSSAGLVDLRLKQPELFGDPGHPPKLDFDVSFFRRYVRNRALTFQYYATEIRGETCNIPYIGLMSTGLEAVRAFLGLSPFEFREKTAKRNTDDILGRFHPATHDQIRKNLDKLRHPEWVSE